MRRWRVARRARPPRDRQRSHGDRVRLCDPGHGRRRRADERRRLRAASCETCSSRRVVVSAGGVRQAAPTSSSSATGTRTSGAEQVVARSRPCSCAAADVGEVRATVRAMQARRTDAQPRKARTFGSVFKNPDEGPGAGQLLEACGLKGLRDRRRADLARARELHRERGGATSADVAALIGEARRAGPRAVRRRAAARGRAARRHRDPLKEDARPARRTEAACPLVPPARDYWSSSRFSRRSSSASVRRSATGPCATRTSSRCTRWS